MMPSNSFKCFTAEESPLFLKLSSSWPNPIFIRGSDSIWIMFATLTFICVSQSVWFWSNTLHSPALTVFTVIIYNSVYFCTLQFSYCPSILVVVWSVSPLSQMKNGSTDLGYCSRCTEKAEYFITKTSTCNSCTLIHILGYFCTVCV